MAALNLFITATEFAAEKHKHQRRKDAAKTPYINHPIEVAALLRRAGVLDGPTLAAGKSLSAFRSAPLSDLV